MLGAKPGHLAFRLVRPRRLELDDGRNSRDSGLKSIASAAIEIRAMRRDIRSDLLIVLMVAGLVVAGSLAASAEPGSAGGSVAGDGRSLSGPRNDEAPPPASRKPRWDA
jgi:hypothetical protein